MPVKKVIKLPLTRFECFFGNEWRAWETTDTATIEFFPADNQVVITSVIAAGEIKTYFNLSTLPVYTFG